MSIEKIFEKVGDDDILKEMLMIIEEEKIEGVKLESLTEMKKISESYQSR